MSSRAQGVDSRVKCGDFPRSQMFHVEQEIPPCYPLGVAPKKLVATDVPKQIQALRERWGITQHELAQRLGIVRQSLYRWETGRCTPGPWLCLALAEVDRQLRREGWQERNRGKHPARARGWKERERRKRLREPPPTDVGGL